ncbi:Alpha-1,6-mannosylglycoprotein 6-beta-N-acetylglucosaminyltransferase A, partial [Trichinella pseudospiralis]
LWKWSNANTSIRNMWRKYIAWLLRVKRVELFSVVLLTSLTWFAVFYQPHCLKRDMQMDYLQNEIVKLSRRYVDDWLEGERRLYWKLTSGLGQSRPLLAKGKPFPPTLTLALEDLYSALHQLETWLLGGFSANCSVNVLHEMINQDLNNIMRQQNALNQGNFEFWFISTKKRKILPFTAQIGFKDWKLLYPSCREKITWMESNWRKYACYGQLGVDETRCSIFTYLSQLERQCPLIWHQHADDDVQPRLLPLEQNISRLHASMDDNAQNYKWMKERMTSTWSDWSEAYSWLKRNRRHLLPKKQLTILVHMGFLTKASGFKFGENAFTGGPLGELVQWSDMITTLHFFGHRLLISSETHCYNIPLQVAFAVH